MITKEVFEEQKALSNRWKEMYYEKKNEVERLTNNWNELEESIKKSYYKYTGEQINALQEVLDKMKEIKEKG